MLQRQGKDLEMDKKIKEKVSAMILDIEKALQEYADRIKDAQTELATIQPEMENAILAGNENAYLQAIDRERYYNNIIALYQQKLEKNDAGISKEQCKDAIAEIVTDLQATVTDTDRKAAKLIKEICQLAESLEAEVKESSELISRLKRTTGYTDINATIDTTHMELLGIKRFFDGRKLANKNNNIYK